MGNRRDSFNNSTHRKRRTNSDIKKSRDELRRKRIRARKRKRKIKRIVVSIFITAILILVASGLYMYSFVSELKTDKLQGAKPPASGQSVNVLVLGMDIGDAENTGNKSARRTDTIMVLNYNPNTKKIHIVSVPRDTMIEVDAYLDGGEYQKYWKMNAAYTLGGEKEVIKHVTQLLGVDINYVMEIDYNAFRGIVDALDGVKMQIEQDMIYDDDAQNLHINFKAGENVLLDGKKAEEFFRWRKNNDGSGLANGDIDRIKNQQKFISAIIDKALSPTILLKAPKLLKAVSENVSTNMSGNEIVSLGLKALRLKSTDIIMTTLKGDFQDIYGQSFLVVDKKANVDLTNALNSKDTSGVNISSVKKQDLKIMVLNATKINGLAGGLKDELIKSGYKNIEVGNAETRENSIIQANDKNIQDNLKSDAKIKNCERNSDDKYKDYDAVIMLGKDYDLFGN